MYIFYYVSLKYGILVYFHLFRGTATSAAAAATSAATATSAAETTSAAATATSAATSRPTCECSL